jgi:nitrous oxidase accessory protein NosD
MSKRAALLLVLVFAIASCLILPMPVKATHKTITVPDDYTTISAAIGNASDGDTVLVRSGNYTESLTIDKSISMLGEESKTTIITAPAGGVFSGQTPITVNANNVKISNLTINNNNVLGFGISVIGNGTEIIGNAVYSQTAISTRAPFTTILENNISGYFVSVQIGTSHCNITNNVLSSNGFAVDLEGSSNIVWGNRIAGHPTNYGIVGYGVLINGNSNIVSDNLIDGEDDGIRVGSYGSYNVVTANSVANCSDTGLRIDRWGFNNTYSENNVTECKYGAGVSLGAYNNTIYHNNFVNNVLQAFASQPGVFNYWDNGKEGNYWSDFSAKYPNATEVDSSGVWDMPYVIDANNTDNYPLTAPFGSSSPEPVSEPFPTLLVVAVTVVVVAVVAAVGFACYFKKRKRQAKLDVVKGHKNS